MKKLRTGSLRGSRQSVNKRKIRANLQQWKFGSDSSDMAPQVGLEPTTLRLTAECSAIELLRNKFRRRPTLPGRVQPSTIGAEGLNFCVRNGNRWDPFAIATGNYFVFRLDSQTLAQHVISCRLESPLRASRAYTLFHPVPLANLHNCTSYSELSLSPFPGLSLKEAFDRLVAATSTRYRAPSAALSTC